MEYIADFVYSREGIVIIEDVKSKFTATDPVYRIKKKLLMYSIKECEDILFNEEI
jgi:hypothetical protein